MPFAVSELTGRTRLASCPTALGAVGLLHRALLRRVAAVESSNITERGWGAAQAAALGNAGGVYNDIGQPRQAISSITAALELDPNPRFDT